MACVSSFHCYHFIVEIIGCFDGPHDGCFDAILQDIRVREMFAIGYSGARVRRETDTCFVSTGVLEENDRSKHVPFVARTSLCAGD